MKFGKSLGNQIEETLPEWGDKFLSYKELKKRLKLIDPEVGVKRSAGNKRLRETDDDHGEFSIVTKDELKGMTREEIDFIRVAKAKISSTEEELIKVRKEIVDFHGEMVVLENYSALNYTGLVKILKKYDKRTGAVIRLPFIQKVLQQPFVTIDLLEKLKECEMVLEDLFSMDDPPSVASKAVDGHIICANRPVTTSNKESLLKGGPNELAEIKYMESLYMKSTLSALRSLREIRSKSSTVSVFSLPPMENTSSKES
ncbi:hypothetical protein MKW98_018342 [Papaver atlanticum]|uniref:SPX domain-containing protein n=1 Tax=Papaver atlanticum TaxID=357466 RepID=A0AAD4TBI8_9MAGN|nr:hypothetical protein MKW98_018342 [Papaver atlanticum]